MPLLVVIAEMEYWGVGFEFFPQQSIQNKIQVKVCFYLFHAHVIHSKLDDLHTECKKALNWPQFDINELGLIIFFRLCCLLF